MIFAYALKNYDIGNTGWLHGLMIVAVAVVAQAVWGWHGVLLPIVLEERLLS